MEQFTSVFGEQQPDGSYEIPARWQAGLSNGTQCGQIIGLIINGYVSERFGYRYTVITCLALITCWVAIMFTATTVQQLLPAYILSGIPWGVFQTLCITYASEVTPIALRGYLTTWVNFCWGLGQIIGVGAVRGCLDIEGRNAYRIPYSLQWMWPIPLSIGIYLAPESPWWLVRKGRIEDAKKSLLRLTSLNREENFDADETVAMIAHTTALEEQITSGASYLDLFKGTDLRRTEIVCMVWAIQNFSGNSFSGYATYFLLQAGLDPENAMNFTLGKHAMNMVGVFGAWFLMSVGIGRRSLYLYGLCGLCAMLCVLGFLGLPEDRDAASLATGSIMLVWAMIYQLTVGTVCYSLVAEISTRRLQIKTVAIGRVCYAIVAIICNTLTPYMLNPSEWDWGNYAGFFWAGICFCSIIYTFFRVPEPRGRTFAELDLLVRIPTFHFWLNHDRLTRSSHLQFLGQ
jgi:MFS transporter, SP family, general alpha glucoside:H+ symporter